MGPDGQDLVDRTGRGEQVARLAGGPFRPGGRPADAFRFVMIDEAFGRGSDESTRFGLELFERLQFQLLVVTPRKRSAPSTRSSKRSLCRPDPAGSRSRLLTMTIGEYRETLARELDRRTTRRGSVELDGLNVIERVS